MLAKRTVHTNSNNKPILVGHGGGIFRLTETLLVLTLGGMIGSEMNPFSIAIFIGLALLVLFLWLIQIGLKNTDGGPGNPSL